jgi:hypothetical protein
MAGGPPILRAKSCRASLGRVATQLARAFAKGCALRAQHRNDEAIPEYEIVIA